MFRRSFAAAMLAVFLAFGLAAPTVAAELELHSVEFNTAPMPGVDNIPLVTMLRYVDCQPAPMPARAMFSVDGTYTNISVRTPNAEELQLQQVDEELNDMFLRGFGVFT